MFQAREAASRAPEFEVASRNSHQNAKDVRERRVIDGVVLEVQNKRPLSGQHPCFAVSVSAKHDMRFVPDTVSTLAGTVSHCIGFILRSWGSSQYVRRKFSLLVDKQDVGKDIYVLRLLCDVRLNGRRLQVHLSETRLAYRKLAFGKICKQDALANGCGDDLSGKLHVWTIKRVVVLVDSISKYIYCWSLSATSVCINLNVRSPDAVAPQTRHDGNTVSRTKLVEEAYLLDKHRLPDHFRESCTRRSCPSRSQGSTRALTRFGSVTVSRCSIVIEHALRRPLHP